MNQSRQEVFQRLRTVCVELSSVALKFKANQVSQKAVLLALEPVRDVLDATGSQNLLDEKLAEYAFFPLTHLFNQSRQLSPQVLEVAVRCVEILVSEGWQDKLNPEMGKQLLLLMCLIVGSSAPQQRPVTNELRVAVFDCISALLHELAHFKSILVDDISRKNIVDQLVYQILDDISSSDSEAVQLSAARALTELQMTVRDPILLASLLPRTISSLVKVLRPSTQARRSQKVFVSYLKLFSSVIKNVLSDSILALNRTDQSDNSPQATPAEERVLDRPWLNATAPQIDLALTQVTKLRSQRGVDIENALLELCLVVLEDCTNSLSKSLPLMLETLLVLCRSSNNTKTKAALSHLLISQPDLNEVLKEKFVTWSQALPRIMQGNDDRPKKHMLGLIATSYEVLTENLSITNEFTRRIASVLVDSVSAALDSGASDKNLIADAPILSLNDLTQLSTSQVGSYEPILLSHQSQRESLAEFNALIGSIKASVTGQGVVQSLIKHARDPNKSRQLSATWLALAFLKSSKEDMFDFNDFIATDKNEFESPVSRPFLIADLYAFNVSYLLQHAETPNLPGSDWRQVALALECIVLQADQLGQNYRPELMETLFPLLSLFSSGNAQLQSHAVNTLNLLSRACEYGSATEMIIENVDYLVNAVALRLNAFDVSEDGLQVLGMMVRLCGARLLPHLDDLIGSVFGALDNFHGYPRLVEHLFAILATVVDESAKAPLVLAIESQPSTTGLESRAWQGSDLEAVLSDLQDRKIRKSKTNSEHEELANGAPHQPWKSATTDKLQSSTEDEQSQEFEDDSLPVGQTGKEKDPTLSTSHRLLIRIAEATVPHMSSPSPKVRLTLLDLLRRICPVLSVDENSFLPLVNTIWPALVPRLLGQDGEKTSQELPYNIKAAADTISIVCESAGSFMASRIDEIFSDLESLFKRIFAIVMGGKNISTYKSSTYTSRKIQTTNDTPHTLQNQLDLVVSAVEPNHPKDSSSSMTIPQTRTSETQILDALVKLLISILGNIRISEDNADKILEMLAPCMKTSRTTAVRDALMKYNDDFVWLYDTIHS